MNYSNLVDRMLTAIPEVRPRFDEENSWWDEILPHVVFGDVVVPVVIEWLSEYQTKNSELTWAFSFFEEMATSSDEMVKEVLGVTVLEQFGDDRAILQAARKFMGNQYADDCNVYVKSRRAGERVMASLTTYLEKSLKLKVNREKSAVDRPQRRKFLGFSFLYGKQAPIRLVQKTIERFKDKVRQITSRSRSMPLAERIRQLNVYLMGWVSYFRLAHMKGHCVGFDEWIRRRLRMCIWKQWKRVRTRYRELRALNQPEWVVHMMANSRRGPWLMAKNLNHAMDKAYFEGLGLKSVEVRYLQLRGIS